MSISISYSRVSVMFVTFRQADLAKVDRGRTPWLIAVLHAPWYNSNSKHQGDGDEMMKSMEFILREAKVDLLIAGHVHAYERTVINHKHFTNFVILPFFLTVLFVAMLLCVPGG